MRLQPPNPEPAMAVAVAAPLPAPAWRLSEGDWVLCDPSGRRLKLTTNERALLASLMGTGGQVVSRDDLLLGVGGDLREADPKRLDVIVSRLRRKARQAGMHLPLHAVRGTGYQFAP
jgi:DNA-binding response OmpR family regulator